MSEVLVDSSVWIDYFRGTSSQEAAILDELLAEELVCLTGLIKAKIIPSAKTSKEAALISESFAALPLLSDPEDMWETIVDWRIVLRKKGISGISIADLIIAAVGYAHDKLILARDRHFELMKEELGISLFRIPSK